MKAKLIFDMDEPEDVMAHLRCTKALDMAMALWDFSNKLRSIYKYGSGEESIDDISKEFHDILEEYNINLEKLIL
jgi:hypothetical protein